MRSRSKSLILALFTVVFLLIVICNLNFNSNNLYYDAINEETSLKSSANEITISTPENITYTEPMTGYYPGSVGFEDDLIGTIPDDWWYHVPDGGSFYRVVDEWQGRKNVYEIRKNGGGQKVSTSVNFSSAATVGSVDFWLYKDTGSGIDPSRINLEDGYETDYFTFGFEAETFYTGTWQNKQQIFPNAFSEDEWHYVRVDFNISKGWQVQIDDTLYGAGYAFDTFVGTPTQVMNFQLESIWAGDNPNYGAWLDSIGYSWDPNYNIGDSKHEGLLLGFNSSNLDWMGYSLDGQSNNTLNGNYTIQMPDNGHHSIQVFGNTTLSTHFESELRYFTINYELPNDITIITPENIVYEEPMAGYYHGTYGFENELHYTAGLDLEFLDEYYGHGAGVYCDILGIDGPFNGHNKILNMRDAQGGTNTWGVHQIDNPQSFGTIEFFLTSNQPTTGSALKRHYIQFRALDNTIAFQMMIQLHDSTLRYYDGSSWQDIITTTPDVWYHHSVIFNCENGTNGQFSWIVSNEQGSELARIEDIEFENDIDTIEEIYIGTTVNDYSGTTIWDAFGFSWDSNYEIGDNRHETLLLGYETEYDLEWQGYSLDGQANVTIFGNTTIPIPANGTHTIQVFGTDSIGTIYQSNLRSFTYGTTSSLQITIQSPDFDDFYGSIAPTYWVTINGEYDTVWYTLDNGVTNITASGLNEIIDQTEWDKVADGIVNLRFYVNNSLGNFTYSDVNFTKDTVAPIITINSPINYEKFGKLAPSFDISIIEPYLDTMWYTIDSGVTNISISSFTGTIDQLEWDKLGNGTVSITFYADDESTNIGFALVIIEKEITPPEITIISPNDNDLFSSTAPSFQLAIQEPDLDTTWYTLDDGVTNISFTGLTGAIDQTEWDKFGNGTVMIKFYANDTFGFVNFSQVTVQKDIEGPVIIINSPEPWAGFSSEAPTFDISVIDVRLDSMWYSLDNGSIVIPLLSTTGTIDQTEWDKLSEGSVYIRFYANDTIGNTAYTEVVVSIDTISPVITINDPGYHELFGLSRPMFNLSIDEVNLDEMWYTLDYGITNVSISSLVELIDQIEWSKVGNGTVTIRFYANDSAGNIGSSQIEILKDIIAPSITINSPNESDVFGLDAPTYSISIVEPHLDMLRYSLDGWSTYFNIISTTGSINQTEWDKFGSGEITLRFFAMDSVGNNISVQVTIYKDISAPVITINSPVPDEIFSSIAPNFNITVFDFSLDSMWYTIDNGTTIIPLLGSTGVIDQTEWDKLGDGSVYLRFYANDTRGYTDYSEVVIVKDFFFGIEPLELITPSAYSNLYSNSVVFSWYSIEAVFGSVNFTLQVSNTTDFSYINYQMENIAEMLVITNFSASLPIGQGQYYWRVRYTYGSHNGSWSDYFSFTLYINNYAPDLVLDECTPTTGTRYTIFRFTVTYTDSDNNPPSYIRIILNGTSYSLEKVNPLDNDFTDGCLYQFLVCLNPAEYAYTFSFECSDGGFYSSTLSYIGPLVETEEPPDDKPGIDNLNSTNAMIMGISVVIGLGIVIPMVVLTEIKIKKHKIKPKQHSKIKK